MKRIFKYAIDCDKKEQNVYMPEFAQIISVQIQHDECQMWALVNPDELVKPRKIMVFVTGGEVPLDETLSFLGTVQLHGGIIVLHVFEKTR